MAMTVLLGAKSIALGITAAALAAGLGVSQAAMAQSGELSAWVEETQAPMRELKKWSLPELEKLKQVSRQEKEPHSGKSGNWRGVLLSDLVTEAMNSLTPERRAGIDLIVLKNGVGQSAAIPRAFLQKNPVLMALTEDGKPLGNRGPVYSVASNKGGGGLSVEGIPLEVVFVPSVERIEFGSSHDHYAALFLKRRTDPGAMRGEKIFRQNCVACHASGRGPAPEQIIKITQGEDWIKSKHSTQMASLRMTGQDLRALQSYMEAHRSENAGGPVPAAAH